MHTSALGAKVQELRKELDWSTRQLAERAMCSQATVCRVEHNQRHPSEEIIKHLDRALAGAPSYKPGVLITLAAQTRNPGHSPALRHPWHLPAIAPLIGRDHLVGQLDAITHNAGATPIVLTGPAGTGKTALAYAYAQRLQHAHPDGTLIVAAHGRRPRLGKPRTTRELVDQILADLGVKPDPDAYDNERSNLLRSKLYRKRMLVVIDDADRAGQIRPLLPGSDGCTVLITSRNTLDGLAIDHSAPARYLDVPPLTTPDSTQLLCKVVDTGRAQAQPTALESIAEACEGLPRAILAAGQYLRRRRQHDLDTLARQLTGPGMLRRLHLAAGDDPGASLLEAYRASHDHLGPGAQTLLQRLADGDVVHITAQRAAHMTNTRIEFAEEILDELAREHLLTPVADGWVLPKLIAEFAAEGVSLTSTSLVSDRL